MKEERYAKDKKYFTDKAKSLGAEVLFASADDNQRTQLEKVEDLLSRGVKAIVIQPVNANSAARLVIASHLDKIPVVAYDRMIKNADLDFYVTQDSFKVGVLQAEAAVKATKGKGNYIILCGEAGHTVADEITAGVLSVLKNHPNIKVVVQQSHEGWSSTKAMTTVENALTIHRNDIQAILANNSGMAQGAIQALAEQKLVGKVFVAGADADLIAIRNIVAGKQQFEVLKAIQPLAERAAEVAVELANHKTPQSTGTMNNGKKDVPVANTPVFPVTKENIQKQIIDYGFHTRQQVYGK
jgi:D-xylose transport system substrate-binding protein